MNSEVIKKRGGRRPGAGRPNKKLVTKINDVAEQVLKDINAGEKWKALLSCGDQKVIADVMKYLTNRVHGCPTQIVGGDKDKPLTVNLHWGSTPEWLPKQ